MKKVGLLLFCLIQMVFVIAQDNEDEDRERFVVKAGSSINDVLSFADRYRYPQFIKGKVIYKTGVTASGKLNYNLLVGEMQFISANGDTLAVDNENTVNLIAIKEDTFLYDNGFLEIISDETPVKLAKKHVIKVVDKAKMGAYGLSSPNSAIDSYNYFAGDNTIYKLELREEITLIKKVEYYIGNQNNNYLIATRKNIMKLFPKHQKAIAGFLANNVLDFSKEEDVKMLTRFLQTL